MVARRHPNRVSERPGRELRDLCHERRRLEDQTRLTNDAATDAWADWSPDGTKIVFQSDRDGNSEIYVMNADGTDLTRITNNAATDQFPAWSPDGSKITFREQQGREL